MLPIAAYADRLSVRPQETIQFHVANATGTEISATLARVICADANPNGPGICLEPLAAQPTLVAEPQPQTVPHGSYGVIPSAGDKLSNQSFTFACRLYPTHLGGREQVIASCENLETDTRVELTIDAHGHLCGHIECGGIKTNAHIAHPLNQRQWTLAWISLDTQARTLRIGCRQLDGIDAAAHARAASSQLPSLPNAEVFAGLALNGTALMVAACDPNTPAKHFNGKLENPHLWQRALTDADYQMLADTDEQLVCVDAIARWNFARDVSTSTIHDESASALHGRLVNSPGRAMTSSKWDGREMHFTHAPEQYSAVHFHDDDIDDCHWPVSYSWTPPKGLKSGIYALLLKTDDAQENVPFHVVPERGTSTAKVAVLASTFTYTIYGNHARPEYDVDQDWRADWHQQVESWGCYPHNPGDHREYGLSTYNTHTDGSGVSIASWHRPMLNVRIGYLTYCREAIRGSGLRHFPADSHLTAWLEGQSIDYDIITDWELHHEGTELLQHYQVVLTGSHPEYHTRPMLDALQTYRDNGGRFCYLGGNGFYWKIATSPEQDGVIEIRRGEGGIRAWAADPGEYYNQFDGEYGGLWRRNGRAPQHLTGVGFTAQGNFHSSYYRRTTEADNPRASWIFAGVDAEIIGNHGLSAHGAAGFELDRADKRLGTPAHALVVASSEDHPADAPWILVPEEVLTHLATWPGEAPEDLIRADMTFFETPNGGAVFSTGSITFCGSLLTNQGDNETSRLVRNVIERFVDPTPFEMPVA